MKLKGLTKLALSGVALAAVAATLGTSTYAWYVSNTTATVGGANGSTAGAETVGSLYAATNAMYAEGSWSNKITLAAGTDYTSNALMPVTKITSDKTTAYNTARKLADSTASDVTPSSSTGFVDKEAAEMKVADGAYLEFSYWLVSRGGNNVKVTPSLTISNTTTDFTSTQKAYSGSYLPGTGLVLGNTFKVDAVRALRVEITNSATVSSSSASASTAASTQTTYLADRDFEAYTSPTDFTAPEDGDANRYYDSIVNGVNLYGCGALGTGAKNCCVSEVEGAANKWGAFWLAPETPTQLTFKIWLEGTDKDCFDSCIGQKFSFDFTFTL